jgi:hypothetical protein
MNPPERHQMVTQRHQMVTVLSIFYISLLNYRYGLCRGWPCTRRLCPKAQNFRSEVPFKNNRVRRVCGLAPPRALGGRLGLC